MYYDRSSSSLANSSLSKDGNGSVPVVLFQNTFPDPAFTKPISRENIPLVAKQLMRSLAWGFGSVISSEPDPRRPNGSISNALHMVLHSGSTGIISSNTSMSKPDDLAVS